MYSFFSNIISSEGSVEQTKVNEPAEKTTNQPKLTTRLVSKDILADEMELGWHEDDLHDKSPVLDRPPSERVTPPPPPPPPPSSESALQSSILYSPRTDQSMVRAQSIDRTNDPRVSIESWLNSHSHGCSVQFLPVFQKYGHKLGDLHNLSETQIEHLSLELDDAGARLVLKRRIIEAIRMMGSPDGNIRVHTTSSPTSFASPVASHKLSFRSNSGSPEFQDLNQIKSQINNKNHSKSSTPMAEETLEVPTTPKFPKRPPSKIKKSSSHEASESSPASTREYRRSASSPMPRKLNSTPRANSNSRRGSGTVSPKLSPRPSSSKRSASGARSIASLSGATPKPRGYHPSERKSSSSTTTPRAARASRASRGSFDESSDASARLSVEDLQDKLAMLENFKTWTV